MIFCTLTELLADSNNFPGLDIAVFGNSINIFKKRISFAGESILKHYYDVLELFSSEYIVEKIEDGFRKKIELVPFDENMPHTRLFIYE